MNVAIIGAGISGLATAYYLSRAGHNVTVYEKAPEVGGLISTFDFDGLRLERFYHFLCANDTGYFDLCRDLGLESRLRWKHPRTGFYHDGTLYPFTSPLDLVRFRAIPMTQRLRFGIFAIEARMRGEWRQLDELTAKPWLIDRLGKHTYDVVWHPLLHLKFRELHDTISAAWVWHRIHRVAKSKGRMGYLEGGTALLIDTLLARLAERGVHVRCGMAAESLIMDGGRVTGVRFHDHDATYEEVISTLPLSVVAKLLPPGCDDYAARLARVQYVGVTCVVLKLKRPASPYFWLNVHDPRVDFNGFIEFTHLNSFHGQHGHIVYVPYYVATSHSLYTMPEEEIFARTWEQVRIVSPHLHEQDLVAHRVFRAPFAQAICPTGFLQTLADTTPPFGGLHLMDSTYLYPEDRTQSGHIIKARELAAKLSS